MASRTEDIGGVQAPINTDVRSDFHLDIGSVDLPAPVVDVVDEYEAVVGDRDRFLWKWIYSLFDAFTLSSVSEEWYDYLLIQKTLFTVYITVLDDLVEKHGDIETFQQARRIPRCPETMDPHASGVDTDVLEFVADVWGTFEANIAGAPRYDQFEAAFEFDLRQSVDAIDYTRLVNQDLSMANLEGSFQYGSHNMVLFPYTDLDLMFSPGFDRAEFGTLRAVVWEVQRLARIGNWLTTWERELAEGDYSAGTVVYALRKGIVSPSELAEAGPAEADDLADRIRRADVGQVFIAEWQRRYEAVRRRDLETSTVDLDRFIRGMETVLSYHLASQGFK